MAKEGSTVSGLMDSFATAVSLALQHGVPLKLLCDKFQHTRFEPSGFTGNQEIPIAKSVMDYIFRWLEIRFVSGQQFPLFKDMIQPLAPAQQLAIGQGGLENRGPQAPSPAYEGDSGMGYTSAPSGGIAPESQLPTTNYQIPPLADRGIYH